MFNKTNIERVVTQGTRRKKANVQHYEKQAYKKGRLVAKALLGVFNYVRVKQKTNRHILRGKCRNINTVQ